MGLAISFEHVSKRFRGALGYRSLRDDLAGAARRLTSNSQPRRRPIRALEDVSFEVPEGSSLALMGSNGSGKTTALKLATRISYPTEGSIRVWGRVAALIEVGTGMHPELTGRENMRLYGGILGYSKREIQRRFDQIVDFAELGESIDQPVKQYSSGMQLRLGFSLASHLEPDILLVDEAISVGDAAFQFKCLERMKLLTGEGVTLVFVSHVPSLVGSLCHTGVLLDHGSVALAGTASEVVNAYLRSAAQSVAYEPDNDLGLRIESWNWDLLPGCPGSLGTLVLRVALSCSRAIVSPRFGLFLADGHGGSLIACSMLVDGYDTGPLSGHVELTCTMSNLPLEPGSYEVWFSAINQTAVTPLIEPRILGYAFLGDIQDSSAAVFAGTSAHAPVRVPYEWHVRR